jgi:hypothetical protein
MAAAASQSRPDPLSSFPGESGPQARPVERALQSRLAGVVGANVLEEAEFAARLEHAPEFGEGVSGVADRAEHDAGDGRVGRFIVEREVFGDVVVQAYGHRRDARCAGGSLAQVGLGLDRDHLVDCRRVVGEVGAVAGPDLDDAPGESGEQLVAARAYLALQQRCDAVKRTREDRVADGVGHWVSRCRRLWWARRRGAVRARG